MRLRITVILLFLSLGLAAQDLPDLTNYQHNWLIFNPAFAGSRDVLSTNLFFKDNSITDPSQPGPKYGQISIHSPFKQTPNNAWGVSYYNEKSPGVGTLGFSFADQALYVENNISGYYSHKVQTSSGKLAFGLSGILSLESVDNSALDLRQGPDPNFLVDMSPILKANFSAGVLYYSNTFFTGISVPRLLPPITLVDNNTYSSTVDDTTAIVSIGNGSFFKDYNIMLAGGNKFYLPGNVTIYPTALVNYIPSVGLRGLNYMAGFNVGIFNEKAWFGTIYKSSKVLSFNMNIHLMDSNLLLGLSWDFPVSQDPGYFKNAFEIVLRYDNFVRVKSSAPFYF